MVKLIWSILHVGLHFSPETRLLIPQSNDILNLSQEKVCFMINCPKCVGILEDATVEDVPCYVCNVCQGFWFEDNQLQELLRIDKLCCNISDLNRPEYAGSDKDIHDEILNKSATCPWCSQATALHAQPYNKHVRVHHCPNGHGYWIDGGEIHKLRSSLVKKGLIIGATISLILLTTWIVQMFMQNAQDIKLERKRAAYYEHKARQNPSSLALYPSRTIILDPDSRER